MNMDCKKDEDLSSAPSSLQKMAVSADGGRSSYIGSIQALSAYYDDDDDNDECHLQNSSALHEQRTPSSPLPFAVDEPAENSLFHSLSRLCSVSGHNLPLGQKTNTRQRTHPEHSSLDHEEGGIVISSPDNEADDDSQNIHWESNLHPEEHNNQSISGPLD